MKFADADSYQAQHRNVEGAKQAAYLPVSPFIESDFQPAVLLTAAQATNCLGTQQFAFDIGTAIEIAKLTPALELMD